MQKLKDVDAYIASFPKPAQVMMRQIRAAIQSAAPKATEKLSYGMPYYGYKGRLGYFGAFKDHVSYFIIPSRDIDATFAKQLKRYQTGKATLQFPLGSKVPVSLIKKVVKARMAINEKAATKRSKH